MHLTSEGTTEYGKRSSGGSIQNAPSEHEAENYHAQHPGSKSRGGSSVMCWVKWSTESSSSLSSIGDTSNGMMGNSRS